MALRLQQIDPSLLSRRKHAKAEAESQRKALPDTEIPALNERNPVDIKENQALTSAASCNAHGETPLEL